MNKLKIIKKIKSYIVISFIVSLCMISCVGDRMKGSGWATPFVNENNVYIGTIEGDLISVDLNTAKENWRASSLDSDFLPKAIYSKPFLFDNKIFVGTPSGKLLGFNIITGLDEVSLQDIEQRVMLSEEQIGPIIVGNILSFKDDYIAIPTSEGQLSLFQYIQNEMFEPICSFQSKGALWAMPVWDKNKQQLIFGSMDGNLYSINTSCDLNWKFETNSSIVSSPVLDDGKIIFGTLNRSFYSIDSNGSLNWIFNDSKGWFWAEPVIDSGVIYASNLDGNIYALRSNSGQIMWAYKTDNPIISSPVIMDDFLIFVSKEGELQVIHKDTKRKLGSCDLNQKVYSSIESYENKIFIQVSDGSLRAYTIKKNGNPDELWNRPFFTEENDKRNNEEWDPAC